MPAQDIGPTWGDWADAAFVAEFNTKSSVISRTDSELGGGGQAAGGGLKHLQPDHLGREAAREPNPAGDADGARGGDGGRDQASRQPETAPLRATARARKAVGSAVGT